MKDNISPEEKLLRLIRGEKKAKDSSAAKQALAIDKKINPESIKLKAPLKDSLPSLMVSTHFAPLLIRRLIIALMASSLIYLLTSFIYPLVGSKKIELPQVPLRKTEGLKFAPKEEAKPYEFYLEATKQRQIFGSVSSQETSTVAVATNIDLIKQLSLVGIIAGDNPQAVIEDKNTQKTYYLNKGQFLGEMQVEDILGGKIIINHKGQRFELYL